MLALIIIPITHSFSCIQPRLHSFQSTCKRVCFFPSYKSFLTIPSERPSFLSWQFVTQVLESLISWSESSSNFVFSPLRGGCFCKEQQWWFVLNLKACFFFTPSMLLLLVAYNTFVILFICMFTYLMAVPSIRGKFHDDRNLLCFMHHCIPTVSHRAWQGVDPWIFEWSVWHFWKSIVLCK